MSQRFYRPGPGVGRLPAAEGLPSQPASTELLPGGERRAGQGGRQEPLAGRQWRLRVWTAGSQWGRQGRSQSDNIDFKV